MRILLILFLVVVTACVQAQTVTGNWYGLAEPRGKGANTNNYLTELILKQKGNEVEGVFGYYFRSGYQSYYIRGTYNPKTRSLIIKNLPMAYFKNRDIDGIECPMDFSATLVISKVKSTLSGAFVSQEKYKYTCPELAFSCTLDIDDKTQDSLIKSNAGNIKKYWKPRNEELVINTKDISTAAMAGRITGIVPKDTVLEKKDSAVTAKVPPGISADSLTAKAAEEERKKELENLKVSFEKRKTILSTEIEIESDSVRISFYDNGDIDGDSISVFINKTPVLTHQALSEKALNMYLAMNQETSNTEVSMFAENLGKFPPNTALMVISDGAKRHEVFLSSSLTQNSAVVLKRKKPGH